ncbi:hypothetical protein [uncultured Jannaschia sp.]|uniref:hypothetical protein n=1 Tax=uncultured Jannaschia sp. TaxID=293347 RepID=UPI002624C88E|nr:hypothetical protein [uncultured Jannaschia sp.]
MTSILHPRTDDRAALAAAVLGTVAERMWLRPESVAQSFALSTWTTIEEMIEREFAGAYRGYYPKCTMNLRAEAVIAEIFDQLAIALDDPRRALRAGEWTPPGGWVRPGAWAGGRSDG